MTLRMLQMSIDMFIPVLDDTFIKIAVVQKIAKVLIFSHCGYLDQFTI